MDINYITGQIVDAALKVHRVLGPGCLESAYEVCLVHELRKRGLGVVSQVPLSATYDGVTIDIAYRIDLLVENQVVVELKTATKMLAVFEAQVLSYLKLSDRRVGLLINFRVPYLKDGIKRIANRV